MRVGQYLNVNGAVKQDRAMERRFVLPSKQTVAQSLRLGAHSFALSGTMQILPIGNCDRIRRPAAGESRRSGSLMKTLFRNCNLRSLLM